MSGIVWRVEGQRESGETVNSKKFGQKIPPGQVPNKITITPTISNGGNITSFGTPLTENFDSLSQSGTGNVWTDDSTLSGGYASSTTYNAGTGSSTTGALYSFGIAGTNPVSDRALGSLASGGTGTIHYAFKLTNNTGTSIPALQISYVGEQWRDGGNSTPVSQTLNFQYQVANAGVITDANVPSTGWVSYTPLNFTSPIFTTTVGALDGNTPANRTGKSSTLVFPTAVSNGQEIWIRWEDINDTGNDHALAIDDLSVTAQGLTAITLAKFSANPLTTGNDELTVIRWETGSEVSNLGFNVYREDEPGKLVRLNKEIIAGSALLVGADTRLTAGNAYSWVDSQPATDSTRYYLEDVDINGTTNFYGPTYPETQMINQPELFIAKNSAMLGDLARLASQAQAFTPQLELTTNGKFKSKTSASESLALQNHLASQAAIKLSITQTGVYRVTQPELLAAGLNPAINPKNLQLFVDGVQIPIKINGEQDNKFDPTDSLEFFATAIDSPFTKSRVYWLIAASQAGLRIADQQNLNGRPAMLNSFPYTVERKDRFIYFSGLRNGPDKENFFGSLIFNGATQQTLTLRNLADEPSATAVLEIALQGVTDSPHSVTARLNDVEIGSLNFVNQDANETKLVISHSLLREGVNQLTLTGQGGNDLSLVNFIRLTYQHRYAADDNALRFSAIGGEQISLTGFTTPDIRVFDITNLNSPVELKTRINKSTDGYEVRLTVLPNGRRAIYAFSEAQPKQAAVKANRPSTWRSRENTADWLVITVDNFDEALKPLAAFRKAQGFATAVVKIEDLYDEFSYGNKTPFAIKDFLNYAARYWEKAPRFVLLAGDASYDAKNYLGFGENDVMPSLMTDTKSMESASDATLADFNNDGIEDYSIGRFPAQTASQLATMVEKTLAFEQMKHNNLAVLFADRNDGFNFEQSNEQVKNLLITRMPVTEIRRGQLSDRDAKRQLLEAINQGGRYIVFSGHGSITTWRGNMLTPEEVTRLTNPPAVFVAMACLNAYFVDALNVSLGESLMRKADGGAVMVWASSCLTFPGEQAILNREFHRLIANAAKGSTLGDAARKAKMMMSDPDVRKSWILLGDPATSIK
ncbi:MAG: C25 family cysteine peptidase [Acidobacteriota bacterium]